MTVNKKMYYYIHCVYIYIYMYYYIIFKSNPPCKRPKTEHIGADI